MRDGHGAVVCCGCHSYGGVDHRIGGGGALNGDVGRAGDRRGLGVRDRYGEVAVHRATLSVSNGASHSRDSDGEGMGASHRNAIDPADHTRHSAGIQGWNYPSDTSFAALAKISHASDVCLADEILAKRVHHNAVDQRPVSGTSDHHGFRGRTGGQPPDGLLHHPHRPESSRFDGLLLLTDQRRASDGDAGILVVNARIPVLRNLHSHILECSRRRSGFVGYGQGHRV